MLTYGDGVGNINIPELIKSHKSSGKYATLTSVRPSGRFGALDIKDDGTVTSFKEKPEGDEAWINGGFFVMEPDIFNYLTDGENTILEKKTLETLASENRLNAYRHNGFWRAMDTLKDKNDLAALWENGSAPWALWLDQKKTTEY
jgi:glucose-1-phosphate cytidylyltransferase